MILSDIGLLLLATLAAALGAYLAFAQTALFSSIVDDDPEGTVGVSYASAALVTRLRERPRDIYLQLTAVRTGCRWLALGCLMLVGLSREAGGAVAPALLGALAFFVLEEELPLRLVLRDPNAWALRLLPPLAFLLRWLRILNPALHLLYRVASRPVRNREGFEPPMSVEELTMMAAAGGADLGADERRMLRGIFRSSGILVADIMTPRERIEGLPASATVSEAIERFRTCRHSRLPIFDGSLDRVTGVAHARDFLRAAFDPARAAVPVGPLLREAYFVRQDRRIQELFEELREGKVHLAVVVDRMGRTVGIVSLEDILEEIVGEIHDELEAGKAG